MIFTQVLSPTTRASTFGVNRHSRVRVLEYFSKRQFKFIRVIEFLKMPKGQTQVVIEKTFVGVHHVTESNLILKFYQATSVEILNNLFT